MSFMANKISSVFYAFPRNRRESNRKMEKSALLGSLDLNLEERPSTWFTMFVTQVGKGQARLLIFLECLSFLPNGLFSIPVDFGIVNHILQFASHVT